MGKSWLRTRAGDIRDVDLLQYNDADPDLGSNGKIFAINRKLKGGMGGAFALRKYFVFTGTVPGSATYWANCTDSVIMAVDAYNSMDESVGAPVLPLLIDNIIVAVEHNMTIGGAANQPTVGVKVAQRSTRYLAMPERNIVTNTPNNFNGATFPTSGWSGGAITSTYDPIVSGIGGVAAPAGALGLIPAEHADYSGSSNKGRWGRDAVGGGKLFWGSQDVFDQLTISCSVTGSNETDAKFFAYFSVFITGWLLPTYEDLVP